MTLIELFDKTPLNNIVGMLCINPDKVIFVGPRHPMIDDTDRIRAVIDARQQHIEIEAHVVDPANAETIRKVLTDIIEEEPACVFDTTGGDERMLMTAADLIRQHGLQSQHIHIPSGTVTDTDGDGTTVATVPPALTVNELITLHGGRVTSCTTFPACTQEEADALWNLTRNHPREWNHNIKLLTAIEKGHRQGQTIALSPNQVPPHDKSRFAAIRAKFTDRGFIDNQSTPTEIRYTYRKPYFRALLEKAGNLLEHKAFYEAKSVFYDGKPLFHDVCMGVTIDWDDQPDGGQKITNNEIDLLVMRGVVPLFISCKNGDVDENELYKLEAVARRFGGHYARTMLIVTELEPDSPQARDALARRAADMDIYLVANAGHLKPEQWSEEFAKAMGLM